MHGESLLIIYISSLFWLSFPILSISVVLELLGCRVADIFISTGKCCFGGCMVNKLLVPAEVFGITTEQEIRHTCDTQCFQS